MVTDFASYLAELTGVEPGDRFAGADGAGDDQADEVGRGAATSPTAGRSGSGSRTTTAWTRSRRSPARTRGTPRTWPTSAGWRTPLTRGRPYFGRLWLWNLAGCSSPKWKAKDEDAYRGTFTKRTSTPVLIVGNYWDPATSYAGAVSTSKRLPNSRLLSSSSWGHTAYGSSDCINGAIDSYLLDQEGSGQGQGVRRRVHSPSRRLLETESTSRSKALEKNSPIAIPPAQPGLR